jgi:hypothetical protein
VYVCMQVLAVDEEGARAVGDDDSVHPRYIYAHFLKALTCWCCFVKYLYTYINAFVALEAGVDLCCWCTFNCRYSAGVATSTPPQLRLRNCGPGAT